MKLDKLCLSTLCSHFPQKIEYSYIEDYSHEDCARSLVYSPCKIVCCPLLGLVLSLLNEVTEKELIFFFF